MTEFELFKGKKQNKRRTERRNEKSVLVGYEGESREGGSNRIWILKHVRNNFYGILKELIKYCF